MVNKNIFLFEIKRQGKNIAIFTAVMVLVLAFFLFLYYPIFSTSKDALIKMFESMPKEYLEAFGFNVDTMFSYIGTLVFGYTFLGVIASILALGTSLWIFAREKKSKCHDFLNTKPVERSQIFLSKLAAALTLIVGSGIVTIIFSLLFFLINGDGSFSKYILIIVGLCLLELVFMSIGILLAVLLKKIRSIGGVATIVGFAAMVIKMLQSILKENAIKLVSPLHFFNPEYVVSHGGYEAGFAVWGIAVSVLCIVAAYFVSARRDIHSV